MKKHGHPGLKRFRMRRAYDHIGGTHYIGDRIDSVRGVSSPWNWATSWKAWKVDDGPWTVWVRPTRQVCLYLDRGRGAVCMPFDRFVDATSVTALERMVKRLAAILVDNQIDP
jgi:hypothetical protein